jgi:transposase
MSQQGRETSLEQRVEIGERWAEGQSDPEIAAAMTLSPGTVRKWRRKYQRQGRASLKSQMGRPVKGALSQSPIKVRTTVKQMRQSHPGWGPLTIRTELKLDNSLNKLSLPSRARIAAFLKEQKLSRKYERHSPLPQAPTVEPQRAHEEWEVDAQGAMKVADLGKVSIINIADLFSRVKIDSLPCLNSSHPNTQDYQLVLRRAFVRYGLPQRISFDHDSVFYDNASASPFPTGLHLWLIALDVEVRFIQQVPPAEHSVIERSHQTVTNQAVLGQNFVDGPALQQSLSQRLDFLNYHFPSRSLAGQPPLVVWPQAQHSDRPYRLEWEQEMLDLQRVHQYLAQGRWFRQTSAQGQFSLGAQRYNLGYRFSRQAVQITFDPQTVEFICLLPAGTPLIRLKPLGLTKLDLMGELSPFVSLPVYQLALPFSLSQWREIILAHELTGTTF